MDGYTVIDNTFLNEFLPQSTGDDAKVYLYGLNLCSNPNTEDNNLDTMSKVLGLSEEAVLKSFTYWQEMGLVQIVSSKPLEIRFLPIRTKSGSSKIRNKEKYSDFNEQMQAIISGRMITPTEYNEYYSLIETHHFEPEALVMIAKYCTTRKGAAISYSYIMAVARDYANRGIKTTEAVEQVFIEYEQRSSEIKRVLDALGLKRDADIEERELYLKWTKTFGFTSGTIVEVAKTLKRRGGFAKLDTTLTKYYEQKLMSIEEIAEFSERQDELFELAKIVTRTIGLHYQDLESVVDVYISDWTNKGYDIETLKMISMYCFKRSIRTLEGMNEVIQKFYKLGLLSIESLAQYFSSIIQEDEIIKKILKDANVHRGVTSYDREAYRTWVKDWGFSDDQILIAAEVCKGKYNTIAYLNKVLANLNERKIKTDGEIEKYLKSNFKNTDSNNKPDFSTRNYSSEDMNALFDSLDDVEV